MSTRFTKGKRLVEYIPTVGERRHIAMVREAKKQEFKHPGSKPMHILRNIIPIKLSSKLSKLFT